MKEIRYNGWSNYPTWCVNVWITNDQFIENQVQRLAECAIEDARDSEEVEKGYWEHDQAAIFILADELKDFVADPEYGMIPDLGASMAEDLMAWSLDAVNWEEIANHIIEYANHV